MTYRIYDSKEYLGQKEYLNPEECLTYFGLNRNKFTEFLNNTKEADFLVYYNTRKLILRVAFENFLNGNLKMKEELTHVRFRKRPNKER